MSKPLDRKLKRNPEQTIFALDEFAAVLRYLKTRGKEGLAQYLVKQCQFSNHFAVVTEGSTHAAENSCKHGIA